MPRPRLLTRSKLDIDLDEGGHGDGPDLKPLGLPPLEDGNNSDEYIDTSLGRCGASDINDEEYIKASHDLLSQSTEELIPRSNKRLRFNLDDECPLFSGNSSAEEKSPWIEKKREPKRRRKSAVVKRYVRNDQRDSDSDDGFSAVNGRRSAQIENTVQEVQTVEIHRPENRQQSPTSSGLISVPFAMIQGCANKAIRDSRSICVLPDQHGFICHLCKYSAKMAYLMENHMKTTHLNEQPYMCLSCRKTFHQRGTAMSHIRIRHPHGSQMVIDQETEARQTDECNKLLQKIYRCHVCEAKSSILKSGVKNPDERVYVCAMHAKNYSVGVNIIHLYQE